MSTVVELEPSRGACPLPATMAALADIHGLIYIPFKDDLQKEAGTILAKEMAARGYHIDIKKL